MQKGRNKVLEEIKQAHTTPSLHCSQKPYYIKEKTVTTNADSTAVPLSVMTISGHYRTVGEIIERLGKL